MSDEHHGHGRPRAPQWFVRRHLPCFGRSPPPCRQPRAERTCRETLPLRQGGSALQGHIRRRGPSGSWEYILDVGRYGAQRCQGCGRRFWIERRPKELCPACGGELRETEERRRETKGGFASRKDCQAALTRKLTTLAEHTYVLPSHLSLREFLLKVWLPAIESGVRQTTLSGYRMLVEQHLVPQLGAVQLQNLNAAQINAHYARLLSEGRVHGSGGLSPNTVHHVHAVLHRALRDAVKWGYLQTNAAACADPPRASAQHRELAVWSEEQLHAFLDSVAEQRLYPLWRFLAMTGCRTRRGPGTDLALTSTSRAAGWRSVRALVPIDGKLCRDRAQDQARAAADRTRCRDGGGAQGAGRPAAGRAAGAGR